MKIMTIGKLAAAGDVGVETIRFYQRRGLLAEPPRNGGVRRYDQTDLRRLRFIRAAQTGGFTLAEIAELLALDATEERARAHALAIKRLADIDEKIAKLKNARRSLQHLADACADRGKGRCPIIEAFEQE